jgi:hypothetical protein
MFHSSDEQARFEKVIELFERAEALRVETHQRLDEEAELDQETENDVERSERETNP